MNDILVPLFIVVFSLERIHSTFSKKVRREKDWAQNVFTSLMLLLYASVVIGGTLFFTYTDQAIGLSSSVGLLILLLGVYIRRSSISTMGDSWGVAITSSNVSKIISWGPYHWSRHPYYWASMLELIGFCLFLNYVFGLIFISVVYFPLLIYRSIREEYFLTERFPVHYPMYKSKTAFFWGRRNER